MRHLDQSYGDVLRMPTYKRRFFLNRLRMENEKRIEQYEEMKNNSGNSKGTRTTKISGEQLKTKLKSGEIPN